MAEHGAALRVQTKEVVRGLGRLGDSLADTRPILKNVGLYLAEISKQSFRDATDPSTGQSWKPLSPAYREWKAAHGYSATPLTKTGQLRRSIHHMITGRSSVAAGTNVKYGPAHQFGGKLPKRPFLGASGRDMNEIQQIVARWIARGAR